MNGLQQFGELAVTPARNAAMLALDALAPPIVSPSTVMSAGAVSAGAVLSTTVTRAVAVL